MSPGFGPSIKELPDAVSWSEERNWNRARWYWKTRSFGPHGAPRRIRSGSLQTQSYLEREHDARWVALGVAHVTSGITANILTLLLPSIFAHSSTDCIPHSEFSLLTLIGTAFLWRK